jgi:ArsR family transcriptional regulator
MNGYSYNSGMNNEEKVIKLMEKLLNVASDFTRLKILYALFDEHSCHKDKVSCGECHCQLCMKERSVNEIVSIVNCSQSLVSHQLKVLKDNNLVNKRKEGTKVYYSLKDGHIKLLLKVVKEHVLEEENND